MSNLVVGMLVALAVDHWLGEPPVRWHPVVWMGNALERYAEWVLPSHGALSDGDHDWMAFTRGGSMLVALASAVVAIGWGVQWVALAAPSWSAGLLLGVALKPLLAWRMLRSEVQAVETALQVSLPGGRERLSWLVSRDVTQLTESDVRESAIESLAENLNDSVVAPLFWFVLFGLPGAALYRFANTADAMWGYKGVYQGRNWEWAGKWAARMDDALSWMPARLTALALALAAGGLNLWRLRREASLTPSPNSGWPMAAMAIAIGVRLHKPDVYMLNEAGREPRAADTVAAIRLATHALVWLAGLVVAVQAMVGLGGVSWLVGVFL